MSSFAVTFRQIASVRKHANADRLDIVTVNDCGYQFVSGRNDFQVGDRVLYFPIDSIMPQALLEKMGLLGKLSGKDKNRIKTVTLRGEISQGIVANPDKLLPTQIGASVAILGPLPGSLSVYDIENAENYPAVLEALMDKPVCVTEKVEGSNFSVLVDDDGIRVNQRTKTIVPIEGPDHDFWAVAKVQGLIIAAEIIKAYLDGASVAIYGEMLGPGYQGNIYGFKEKKILVFDIKANGAYVDYPDFSYLCMLAGLAVVPVLHLGPLREFLAGRTVREASHGKSTLFDTLREGIVIKPLVEERIDGFGRAIIKQRDPVYLSGSES